MRFEEAYGGWNTGRLTQEEAARLLGVGERSFRRYVVRYEAEGLEGLIDRRLEQLSNRRALVDEVMAVVERCRDRHLGWNVRHFHSWYRREGGVRSYSWVKNWLQEAGVVEKAKWRGTHRTKRESCALPGTMIHQDGSRHEWLAGQVADLIVTWTVPRVGTTRCFSWKKAPHRAFAACARWSLSMGCAARSTATGAATTGRLRKRAARSIVSARRSSGGH